MASASGPPGRIDDSRPLDRRRVVSKKGIATLLRPVASATMGAWDHHQSRYGMGWYVGGPWGERVLLHPGGSPDSSSMIALLPGRELAVVTLANANTEMPLPGIDGSLDRIPRGVVSLLVGEDPQTGMTLTRFYVIFDLAVVVVLAGLGWSLVRLARRRADGGSRLRLLARAGRGCGEVVLGSVLVIAPSLPWKGYAVALLWVPDLVVVFLAVGGLLVITGVARLGLLRGLERRATGPTSPADHVPRV